MTASPRNVRASCPVPAGGAVRVRTRASVTASSTWMTAPSVATRRPASASAVVGKTARSRMPDRLAGSSTAIVTAVLMPPAVVTLTVLPLPVGWLTMMLSLARKESFPTRLLPGFGTLTAPKRTDRSVFSVKPLPRRRTWVPVKR